MLSKLVCGCGCDGGGTLCVCGTGLTPPASLTRSNSIPRAIYLARALIEVTCFDRGHLICRSEV